MDYHLAQINIGRAVGDVDGPLLVDFMAWLDPINALADDAPGFVWRMQDESGNNTGLRPYEDERMIINMSVWESAEALYDFVYASAHVEVFKRRREWFERFPTQYMALWWIPAGTIPTVDDAKLRLASLDAHGPTPYAFTFKQRFAPSDIVVPA